MDHHTVRVSSMDIWDALLTSSPGFRPSIGTLDSMAGHIPKDGPVIIVTASFEGSYYHSRLRIHVLTMGTR